MTTIDKLADEVEAWILAKGACHYKEVMEEWGLPREDVTKLLGLLMYEGRVATPWTTRNGWQVWYRHADTAWLGTAGKLRDESRRAHPEVWPVKEPRRVRKPRPRKTDAPSNAVVGLEREQEILDFIKRSGPVDLDEVAVGVSCARSTVRRYLGSLANDGLIESVNEQTGQRGRPKKLWGYAANGDEHTPVEMPDDDDDWQSVVQILDD